MPKISSLEKLESFFDDKQRLNFSIAISAILASFSGLIVMFSVLGIMGGNPFSTPEVPDEDPLFTADTINACNQNLEASIGGLVYLDIDRDGTYTANVDRAISGTVMQLTGNSISREVTSDENGEYLFDGLSVGQEYQIEVKYTNENHNIGFVNQANNNYPEIFFITPGNCDVNINTLSALPSCEQNPDIATSCFVNGSLTTSTDVGSLDALVSFAANNSGTSPGANKLALAADVGSTWGLAHFRSQDLLLSAAMLKRHSDMKDGATGIGKIYGTTSTSQENGSHQTTLFLDVLADLSPAPDLGQTLYSRVDGDLSGSKDDPNYDPTTFEQIGKIGMGDIDISQNDKHLYITNLFSRSLIVVDLESYNSGSITHEEIFVDNSVLGCSNSDFTIWGLETTESDVFLGAVCTAETSQNSDDLVAHVLKLVDDEFVSEYSLPLSYDKGRVLEPLTDQDGNPIPEKSFSAEASKWHFWINEFSYILDNSDDFTAEASIDGILSVAIPQPILSDIEQFDDGSFILGFSDRTSHQTGRYQYGQDTDDQITVNGTDYELYEGMGGGDIVKVCKVGDTYITEGQPGCESAVDQDPNEGAGGDEFFYDDRVLIDSDPTYDSGHKEIILGGLAHIPQSSNVISTVYDAVVDDSFEFRTGGVRTFNTQDGSVVSSYQVYGDETFTFGKAGGLGDLEPVCEVPELQIGNRVWEDTNGNGIQELREPALAGVEVVLREPGSNTVIATATTNSEGYYYFVGPQSPTNTASDDDGVAVVANGISYLTDYEIEITTNNFENGAVLENYTLSPSNTNSDTLDLTDSDGVEEQNTILARFTTGFVGENNYAYDFGFMSAGTMASIGDRVWMDVNSDGILDSGEEGIANVSISLLDDSGQEIGLTSTNSDGNYLFSNLADGTYSVRINTGSLPTGVVQTYENDTNPDGLVEITIQDSTSNLEIDFGYNMTSSIGDYIYYSDNDGDAPDTDNLQPAVGVTVNLLDGGSPTQDLIRTEITDSSGQYLFDNLPAGNYIVQVDTSVPDSPLEGFTNGYDLDGDKNDRTEILLEENQNALDADFGYFGGETPPTPEVTIGVAETTSTPVPNRGNQVSTPTPSPTQEPAPTTTGATITPTPTTQVVTNDGSLARTGSPIDRIYHVALAVLFINTSLLFASRKHYKELSIV